MPSANSSLVSGGILVKEGVRSLGTARAESSFGGNTEVISMLSSKVRIAAGTSTGSGK